MKNDLCKAAVTIHRLKRERDEYKVSYELLKEDSTNRMHSRRNSQYLEEILETNENLQQELIRYKRLLLEKDRVILDLEKTIKHANSRFKRTQDDLRDLDSARRELKTEINNTNLSSENYPMYSDISHLAESMIRSLHQIPEIDKIFKSEVKCKKRFKLLVDQENYSICFRYLVKFILNLVDSFQFCEESQYTSPYLTTIGDDSKYQSAAYTTEDSANYHSTPRHEYPSTRKAGSREDMNSLEESLRQQSQRLQKLNQKMTDISGESLERRCREKDPIVQVGRDTSEENSTSRSRITRNNRSPGQRVGREKAGGREEEERDSSVGGSKGKNSRLSKSRSPPRSARALADKYQEYCSPIIRKTDCWGSAAEFFGGENHAKKK